MKKEKMPLIADLLKYDFGKGYITLSCYSTQGSYMPIQHPEFKTNIENSLIKEQSYDG